MQILFKGTSYASVDELLSNLRHVSIFKYAKRDRMDLSKGLVCPLIGDEAQRILDSQLHDLGLYLKADCSVIVYRQDEPKTSYTWVLVVRPHSSCRVIFERGSFEISACGIPDIPFSIFEYGKVLKIIPYGFYNALLEEDFDKTMTLWSIEEICKRYMSLSERLFVGWLIGRRNRSPECRSASGPGD